MLLGRRGGKTNSSLAIIRYSYIPGDAAWCSGLQLAAEISIKKLMEQRGCLQAGQRQAYREKCFGYVPVDSSLRGKWQCSSSAKIR
jgi:hypothetical protein